MRFSQAGHEVLYFITFLEINILGFYLLFEKTMKGAVHGKYIV